MPAQLGPTTLKCDTAMIRHRFGHAAELYAETRSSAAHLVGNEEGKRHWDKVAARLSEEAGD